MSWEETLDKRVRAELPDVLWMSGEPLSKHTSLRIGGPAKRMAFPKSSEDMTRLVQILREENVRAVLLGNGTNVLCPDEGLDAVVIATGDMAQIERHGDELWAEAGVSLARLAAFAWKEGLTGLEFAHGIPGSLGGGIVMNAGAYGNSMSDVLVEVKALWKDRVRTLQAGELSLSYRHSIFSEQPEAVVLSASVRLQPGESAQIKARMDELMDKRKSSQPLEFPSAGSTFKRPEGYFAGRLIEQCGLKGVSVGGAQVSTKHAGFVINTGGATCGDVLGLIEHIQKKVHDDVGVMLEPEVKLLR